MYSFMLILFWVCGRSSRSTDKLGMRVNKLIKLFVIWLMYNIYKMRTDRLHHQLSMSKFCTQETNVFRQIYAFADIYFISKFSCWFLTLELF